MYLVRKLKIGTSEQLDNLAQAAGELYTDTLVYFWRVVRKKGIWLSSNAMERIKNSKKMHSHSADATVQSFFHGLASWNVRREVDPQAKPPKRRRKYFKVQWKEKAIRIINGELVLSNGRGNEPLRIPWKWEKPVFVSLVFDGNEYVLIPTYKVEPKPAPLGDEAASVDLGEVHPAAVYNGKNVYLTGRLLRSKKQYRNKILAKFQRKLSPKTKGSRSYVKTKKAQYKELQKIDNQIRDITHKQTTLIISTLKKTGVQTVVFGDIRDIRLNGKNLGKKSNQKVHQMSHGSFRHMLTYKAKLEGMNVELINEAYTSQECPQPLCRKRNKTNNRNYRCRNCGFNYHRDGIGAINIYNKYRDEGHVIGAMVSPISLRYTPHMKCRS